MQILVLLPFLLAAPQDAPPSPAQRAERAARLAIESRPDDAGAHAALAFALARRARETADPSFYEAAQDVVRQALELNPEDLEARKAEAWILLGTHDFAAAHAAARELNRSAPDDVLVYGFLVDAAVELGRYEEAEEACQWMLDLRPGNVPALTRAAYLRELFGDVEGAVELLQQAYPSVRTSEVEDRAWILAQLAHLHRSRGDLDAAEACARSSLELFPDYHYALAELGRVAGARGHHAEAAELLRRRHELAPHPENLFDVAAAELGAGERDAAREHLAAFERAARAEMESPDNANRELIALYAEERFADVRPEGRGPADALEVAELEIARRGDVHTKAAYARALLANGRAAAASGVITGALEVGIRDAEILHLAGQIAAATGDAEAERRHLQASLAANPRSPVAAAAQARLRELEGAAGGSAAEDSRSEGSERGL